MTSHGTAYDLVTAAIALQLPWLSAVSTFGLPDAHILCCSACSLVDSYH